MEDAAKQRLRRIVVIAVAVVLVAAGVYVAWEVLRSRTIAEVFLMDHWEPGSQIAVEGTTRMTYNLEIPLFGTTFRNMSIWM